jgi:uncharacterized membrane protein
MYFSQIGHFLAPLLAASAIIQFHVAVALVSVLLSLVQLLGAKFGMRHKVVGWAFVASMAGTAVSSFWIMGRGHFSPIHILSVVTLVSLPVAVVARRQGNIRRHSIAMLGVTAGLLVAGLFTLLPGRIMGRVIFGL